ncbi:hypothetical protein [Actinomadura sp. BRA 177]|uniref:hypothetical protein n=1 Tax=Actinomadura sp. BRA 177 TaxID=2745202 RepID=UPI001594FBCF|nr:hypothetical protein [Actinomadura sp. BRA 177]NVI87517.1 hypothetical protein [Actinomadura sp. BRA 177]
MITPRDHVLERVTEMLVPPCALQAPAAHPDWTVRVDDDAVWDQSGAQAAEGPELVFPRGGPRLRVLDNQAGRIRVLGFYRPYSAMVVIEADASMRMTRFALPSDDVSAVRWADWLGKVFFASRLLDAGWLMLHASAVAVDGVALVFLAEQRGGKSTLAHRACTELGAAFLADDLVLVGLDGTVIGWPTRVCLPDDLPVPDGAGTVLDRVVRGRTRRRRLLTPAEHRTALGMTHSPPVPLGAVVGITSADHRGLPVVQGVRLEFDQLASTVAEALTIPAQRLYTSDLLGLTGGPRTTGPAADDAEVVHLLSQVPGALLSVGDPAALSTAPVWDALKALVPGMAGAAR